jgi:hypothetical protein
MVPVPDPRPLTSAEAQAAEDEAGLVAHRAAWGPNWPYWLSMTDIEPDPEAEADLF